SPVKASGPENELEQPSTISVSVTPCCATAGEADAATKVATSRQMIQVLIQGLLCIEGARTVRVVGGLVEVGCGCVRITDLFLPICSAESFADLVCRVFLPICSWRFVRHDAIRRQTVAMPPGMKSMQAIRIVPKMSGR